MKRYLLFKGDSNYPAGGWDDFINDYETIEEAEKNISTLDDWYQIVDVENKYIVKECYQ